MPYYPLLRSLKDAERKRAAHGLVRLKNGLSTIPEKRVDGNLLLATWNIREFGGNKYGGRSLEPLYFIAEIISRFDLVAVQELRDDIAELQTLMKLLGGWWKVLHTDVTEGRTGNSERTGFIYDSRKISFGGLAGEVVLPPIEGAEAGPAEQISRSPMIVGFRAGWFKFTICTTHLYYGSDEPDEPRRLREMKNLATFLAARVKEKTAWAKNMIVLGDFNIFKTTDETFKALAREGFKIPRGMLGTPTNVAGGKPYDQIAFIAPTVEDQLEAAKSGVFSFQDFVYRDEDEPEHAVTNCKTWRTYKMSDHLPLWVELKTDFGIQYLEGLKVL